ncbi:hypothetical protein AYI68_g6116 [Smittium mucronatum]|uniref:RAI1-like domain-containing protein n=1 Tax=Smittium mucronatum TaxID=133383 RepID=A0A1R0GSI2_9FUNG|nr:hypothetical protein AYI68_g6116 [Smittium mucronatum]
MCSYPSPIFFPYRLITHCKNVHNTFGDLPFLKGTIFIENYVSHEERLELLNVDEKLKKFMYGGYRFESIFTANYDPERLFSDKPISLESEPINNNMEYTSVYSAFLDDFKFVMGAETDCIQGTHISLF